MKEITTVGVDLAKVVFTVHAVDAVGRVVLRKTVRREKLMELIAGLAPCLIGMEACGGAHEWARRFEARGHRVGIMMARFVTPYRKSSKNEPANRVSTPGPAAGTDQLITTIQIFMRQPDAPAASRYSPFPAMV